MKIGPENGNNFNKFIVGTHSGYIDATFITSQWTDWDLVSIGFRKTEPVDLGHNAIIGAGTGDPLYTDFSTYGIQIANKIQIATDLYDGGTGTYTDTNDTPTDSQNLRIRINLALSGAVTYQFVKNAIAGAGTLAAPSATAAFTFDSADTLIPYIMTHCVGAVDNEILLKDITIVRDQVISYTN